MDGVVPASLWQMISSQAPEPDQRLERFAGLVASSRHNLVSRRAREELLTRHVPECVALAHALPQGRQRVLDVGSGGGFPGMIVAIVRPELDVHLLDGTAKKTGFLRDVADQLDVAVTVHTGRAEALTRPPLEASFDVVTARAVAPLDRLIPWTVPFLRPGGVLYAIKGERWAQELDDAVTTIERAGAHVVATPDDTIVDEFVGVAPRIVMLARDR